MSGPVVALSGGIGGAKLALGLLHALPPHTLTVIANTGDDLEHLGLTISPDIDTLLYALSDRDDTVRGWGRRDETWNFMNALREIGGETWFNLGDRDLAIHVERTRRLRAGERLGAITADLCQRFGIAATIVPMSDDPVRTRLRTDDGWTDFQPWFVGQQAKPRVHEIVFNGAEAARLPDAVTALLRAPSLRAVVICPSNPYVSIEPILAVPGMRAALAATTAPVVAVSPIIGGRAVKGPTAAMMANFGTPPDALVTAHRYRDIIGGYVMDEEDRAPAAALGDLPTAIVPTLMRTLDDRIALARAVLALADRIRG
jgi:LPPG:FO 2-phospho-L-lactate transferase